MYRRRHETPFSRFLCDARKRVRKTREEIAKEVGKSVRSVGRWELGQGLPPRTIFKKLIAAYGVEENEFLNLINQARLFSAGSPQSLGEAPLYKADVTTLVRVVAQIDCTITIGDIVSLLRIQKTLPAAITPVLAEELLKNLHKE